jgi:hypothetical protein
MVNTAEELIKLINLLNNNKKLIIAALHILRYMIVMTMTKILQHDPNISNEEKKIRKADAFNYMMYFYDILSYLEHDLMLLRNNKSGKWVRKQFGKNPPLDPLKYSFLKLNDTNYTSDHFYKTASWTFKNSNVTAVRKTFYALYDDVDRYFKEAKDELENYLNYIRQYYGIDYNLKYGIQSDSSSTTQLLNTYNKMHPNHSNFKVYSSAMIDGDKFIKQYKIFATTDISLFSIPKTRVYKKVDGIGNLVNMHTALNNKDNSPYSEINLEDCFNQLKSSHVKIANLNIEYFKVRIVF